MTPSERPTPTSCHCPPYDAHNPPRTDFRRHEHLASVCCSGAGLFEPEGLTVDVRVIGSSVKQQEALIGGEIRRGIPAGRPRRARGGARRGPRRFRTARPCARSHARRRARRARYRRISRGRAIAVDGARTGYALLLRRLLRRNGLGEGPRCRLLPGDRRLAGALRRDEERRGGREAC